MSSTAYLKQPGEKRKAAGPRLSREEYMRLLSAARSGGRQRVYLVMKTIVSTGMMIEELPNLTVEAVRKGCLDLPRVRVLIPDFLRRELLEYAAKKGIAGGMVFQTRGGKPVDRSNLNHEIKALAGAAGLPEEKCTPRCLRQLYQRTQKNIRDDVEVLVQREFRRILENEQAVVGWDA